RDVFLVGALFELVRGAARTRIQSQNVACLLEEDLLQQSQVEDPGRLDTQSANQRRVQPLFRGLPGQRTQCLRLPSSDAARSQIPTLRRSRGSRDARSSACVIESR